MTKPTTMTKQHFDMVSDHGCVLGWGCQKCVEQRVAAVLRECGISARVAQALRDEAAALVSVGH